MRSDKAAREQAYSQMCDMFRPYLGRVVAEWRDKNKDGVYIWLVCSRNEDAGDGRHQWRGTVAVRIMPDGATFVFPSETLIGRALGLKVEGTWTYSETVLDALVPNLPEQSEAA